MLRDAFPRVALAEDLYSEKSVKERAAKVYDEVMGFAEYSITYLRKGSARKLVG